MDKFTINGGRRLSGTIRTDGSKNAALPIIVSSILFRQGEIKLKNIPPIRDIFTTIDVLKFIGAEVEYNASGQTLRIDCSRLDNNTAPYDLMRKMRASFLVLGPLLARFGEARVSLPGGCTLGARPVDYHIAGFGQLGARIK
jgi:UDP-N-acetylglucosamine 1-carboxyvinyltransferase